jgi:hypothetical protein
MFTSNPEDLYYSHFNYTVVASGSNILLYRSEDMTLTYTLPIAGKFFHPSKLPTNSH